MEAANATRLQVEYRNDRRIAQRVRLQGRNSMSINDVLRSFTDFLLNVVAQCKCTVGLILIN